MTDFPAALRTQRLALGLTQANLASELRIARSTLANVEAGREVPTPRLWVSLEALWADWALRHRKLYEEARTKGARGPAATAESREATPFLGGPFTIESLTYTYVFEESLSPSEVIEIRTVRATESGASTFGLLIGHTASPLYVVDQQALWGGSLQIDQREVNTETQYWRRVEFGRSLRKGQSHEFALRTWVERDPDPQTAIVFSLTVPAKRVSIHVSCLGTPRAAAAWRYGPSNEPDPTDAEAPRARLKVNAGSFSAQFIRPEVGPFHGVSWDWQ